MPLKRTELEPVERRRWPRDLPLGIDCVPERPPALKPLFFSTRHLAPGDQFDAWREHYATIADVMLPDGGSAKDGFAADHTAWNLEGMLLTKQSTPAHRYVRSAAGLRASSVDHLYAMLIRNGRTWTEVDRHVAHSKAGAVQFGSLGYPFSGRSTACESVVLYLPRDMFERVPVTIGATSASILLGDSAMFLHVIVNSIEARLHSLTTEDLPRIKKTMHQMILACLDPSTASEAATEHMSGLMLMERARRHVQSNLGAADLSPVAMARALGVSRTRLYRLFELTGGVLHYIQKRRLHAAHLALGDPTDNRRIIDIADGLGFNSAANFSKSFSKEFGYSPREVRNAVRSHGLSPATRSPDPDAAQSFHDWLKILGG